MQLAELGERWVRSQLDLARPALERGDAGLAFSSLAEYEVSLRGQVAALLDVDAHVGRTVTEAGDLARANGERLCVHPNGHRAYLSPQRLHVRVEAEKVVEAPGRPRRLQAGRPNPRFCRGQVARSPTVGEQLYAAVLTSVPFLLLALVAETKVFGPAPQGKHRRHHRWDAILDTIMLVALLVAFGSALWGLAVDEPPDLRLPAAYGLGLGALAAFVHAAGRVLLLYRRGVDEARQED
jgi:hypothetical protein